MRTRLIALFVLLAVTAAGPSMALPIPAQEAADAQHAHHHKLPDHACCPSPIHTQTGPPAAPATDHRCCFLRGSVSSLPVNVAGGKKLTVAGLVQASNPGDRPLGLFTPRILIAESNSSPPHSLQMNVVLRN
jgi:hypothetical protein